MAIKYSVVDHHSMWGWITDSEYTERKNRYQEEVKKIQRKIEQLSKADEEYYILAESILSLAQRAGELFESSEMEQKKQIINLTLQNLTLDEKKLSYDLIKPFDVILKSQDSHNWLPVYDIFMNLKLRIEDDIEKLRLLYNAFDVDSELYIE